MISHGTNSCYTVRGCRRPECRAAHAEYQRDYERRRYGREPRVRNERAPAKQRPRKRTGRMTFEELEREIVAGDAKAREVAEAIIERGVQRDAVATLAVLNHLPEIRQIILEKTRAAREVFDDADAFIEAALAAGRALPDDDLEGLRLAYLREPRLTALVVGTRPDQRR